MKLKIVLLLGIVILMSGTLPIRATVTNQNSTVSFTCTGGTGPFPFSFPISASTALSVIQNGTTLLAGTYTISPVNNNYSNGGSVTLNSACSSGTLLLQRNTPLTQTSVFSDNMPVPMATFERGLDKGTEQVQDLTRFVNEGMAINGQPCFLGEPCTVLPYSGGTVCNLIGIRCANEFPGVNPTTQQTNAITDLGSSPGVVLNTYLLGPGTLPALPNNISVLDLRQTQDSILGTNAPGMVRTPVMQLTQTLGDLTAVNLTGNVTLTVGSTSVTGVGTKFTTELATTALGRSVRVNSDPTTCWAQVASVTNDTTATLVSNYPGGSCAGGSGTASYFTTQLGMLISNTETAGTPNTMVGGESVGLSVYSYRSGGSRGLYSLNTNTNYSTAASSTAGQVVGQEIDLNNNSGTDDTTGVPTYGLDIISAGTNHPNAGIAINAMTSGAAFRRGLVIFPNAYTEAGVDVIGASDMLRAIPTTTNNSPAIGVRNTGDTTYLSALRNDGSAEFAITETNPSSETIGTASSATGIAISGANTHDVTGAYGQAIVDPTNTQNWTDATPSFRGLIGQYHMSSGATGIVSNAAAVFGDIVVDAGTTTTNGYHFYAKVHEGSGTLTNEYSYGAASGAGVAYVSDGFRTDGNLVAAGYTITTPGTIVTAGTCSSGGTVAITGLLTTSAFMWSTAAALPATWQTGIHVMTDVSTGGTAKVWLCNGTGGDITPVTLVLNIKPIL